PGTGYTIEVSLTGYSTGTSEAFDVVSDNVSGINCQLAVYTNPTYTISGAISTSDDGSAAGASVQLKNSGGSNVGSVVFAGLDGAYSISSVPAGTGYTIVVSLTGYRTGTIAAFNVSANVSGKNFTLDRLYTVSGAITTDDGGSAAGAKVQLKSGDTNVGSAVTAGASGEYTIPNVLAGTYTIEVSLTGYRTGTSEAFDVVSANVAGNNLQLVKQKTLKITGITGISGTVTAVLYGGTNNSVRPAGGTATVVNGTAIITLKTFSNNAFTATDWIGEPGDLEWSVALWEGEEDAIHSRGPGYDCLPRISFSNKETEVQFIQFTPIYTLKWGVWVGATYTEVSSGFTGDLSLTSAGPNAGYLTGARATAVFDAIAGVIQAGSAPPFNASGEIIASFENLMYFSYEDIGFPDALKTALRSNKASAPLAGVCELKDESFYGFVVVFYITKD
ncbi:MAG: carboxypeptidase-like regulatory domain-containing protein, partial [Spirochaetales bacterium]|nr:carboxypeptidase-like regulatory domain-containing protein [Spirochaetales bacterium]